MKTFTPRFFGGGCFSPPAVCADAGSQASAASGPDSLAMTCAQVPGLRPKKHGQTLLATGKESGNYSFDYAECGGDRFPGSPARRTRPIATWGGGCGL